MWQVWQMTMPHLAATSPLVHTLRCTGGCGKAGERTKAGEPKVRRSCPNNQQKHGQRQRQREQKGELAARGIGASRIGKWQQVVGTRARLGPVAKRQDRGTSGCHSVVSFAKLRAFVRWFALVAVSPKTNKVNKDAMIWAGYRQRRLVLRLTKR